MPTITHNNKKIQKDNKKKEVIVNKFEFVVEFVVQILVVKLVVKVLIRTRIKSKKNDDSGFYETVGTKKEGNGDVLDERKEVKKKKWTTQYSSNHVVLLRASMLTRSSPRELCAALRVHLSPLPACLDHML